MLFCLATLSHYFVEPPFIAITAAPFLSKSQQALHIWKLSFLLILIQKVAHISQMGEKT